MRMARLKIRKTLGYGDSLYSAVLLSKNCLLFGFPVSTFKPELLPKSHVIEK